MVRRGGDAKDWTSGARGRGRNRPTAVAISTLPRLVTQVAFDQFVFDDTGLSRADGSTLVRGTTSGDLAIAVGSAPWPAMPVEWAALQSRRGSDLLGLAGDEMERVGHRSFDDRFAVDADDVSLFRKLFRTSLREWLVEFDDENGPVVVIFDGGESSGPRRRSSDVTDPADPTVVPTVFLAREVGDDRATIATLDLVGQLAAHVAAAVPG